MGKVEEERCSTESSSNVAKQKNGDVNTTTFPFGEGGPLAVDEVDVDHSKSEDMAQTVGTGGLACGLGHLGI